MAGLGWQELVVVLIIGGFWLGVIVLGFLVIRWIVRRRLRRQTQENAALIAQVKREDLADLAFKGRESSNVGPGASSERPEKPQP